MNIYEFSDLIGTDLNITYHSNQNRFTVNLDNTEIKNGIFLTYLYGNGTTIQIAINDYLEKIIKKKIVVNANTNRMEYNVPNLKRASNE